MLFGRRKHLQLISGRPGEMIVVKDGPSSSPSKRSPRKLLGAIIGQAMNDRMLRVQIGYHPASGKPVMRYYGPADDPSPRWWDAVAPPPSVFGRLLKTVFAISDLDESLPVAGRIQAGLRRARVDIRVEFHGLETFELSWTPAQLRRFAGEEAGR